MWKSGTAVGHIDLLEQLDAYIADQGSAFGIHFDAGNTGLGRVVSCSGGAASVAETFTLVCQGDGRWEITGSESGSIGSVTPGTPFTSTYLCIDLAPGDPEYASGDWMTICTAPPWVRLTAKCEASSTRWRVRNRVVDGYTGGKIIIGRLEMYEGRSQAGATNQCSGGTASASSVYYSQVAAYAFDDVQSTYWQASGSGESWIEYQFATAKAIKQIAMTPPSGMVTSSGARFFDVMYYDGSVWRIAGSWYFESGQGSERRTYDLYPYIWQGPGNDGNAPVIVGANPMGSPNNDAYAWRLNGYTGHSGSQAGWFDHPGHIPPYSCTGWGPLLLLTEDPTLVNPVIEFWFYVNGRRIIVVAKMGTCYMSAYLGLILPFADPGNEENPGIWPYPLAVGGSFAASTEPGPEEPRFKYSYNDWQHGSFPTSWGGVWMSAQNDAESKLRVRNVEGEWLGFFGLNADVSSVDSAGQNNKIWPFANGFQNMKQNLDGSACLMPCMLYRTALPVEVFGELDGVFAVPGDGVGAETVIYIGCDAYRVFLDGLRSGNKLFCVKED